MDENTCRICLESSQRLKSITDCQCAFDVKAFILKLCDVSIHEADGYSDKICRTCLEKLQAAHSIRLKCIESDELLRTQIVLIENSEEVQQIKYESLEDNVSNQELFNVIITEKSEPLSESRNIHPADPDDCHVTVLELKEEADHGDFSVSSDNDVDATSNDNEKSIETKTNRCRNQEKTHMCSVCGKTFFTSGHLRSHELTHNESKDFSCLSCGKKFLTKSYLNRHMKSHLNERSYKCKVCQKGFNTSTTLGYHFRLVHSGETKFHCTFCNKGFPLKIQLISHTRSHTGEKPHKCDRCEKKYSHKIDLKRHMMLHTGNKAYKCPHCERTFTKKSNMECHIPIHTGEKPYKCSVCFKEFRQPCPYKKHLQTHGDVSVKAENSTPVPVVVIENTSSVS